MPTLTQNVLQWALPAGDIAQSSIWVYYGGGPTTAQAHAAFKTSWVDSFWPSGAGGGKAIFYSNVVLNQVETRVVGIADGKVITTAKTSYSRPGTGATGSSPNECSVCITLRTALAGPSHRGRSYMPPPATAVLDSAGSILSGSVSTLVTAFGTASTAMNAVTTYTSAAIVIWSRKNLSYTNVVSVEGGTVVDAQRRRRNALVETRTSVAL